MKNMWILWAPDFNPTKNFLIILNSNYNFEVDVNGRYYKVARLLR